MIPKPLLFDVLIYYPYCFIVDGIIPDIIAWFIPIPLLFDVIIYYPYWFIIDGIIPDIIAWFIPTPLLFDVLIYYPYRFIIEALITDILDLLKPLSITFDVLIYYPYCFVVYVIIPEIMNFFHLIYLLLTHDRDSITNIAIALVRLMYIDMYVMYLEGTVVAQEFVWLLGLSWDYIYSLNRFCSMLS
jgi:hypothetical protein